MSNPAQPSFVWQIYSHDLEPHSSYFAVRKACETLHIQMNEDNWHVMVVNHAPTVVTGLVARAVVCNLDGSQRHEHEIPVIAAGSTATDTGAIAWPASLSAVHFVKLELCDRQGKVLADNFYWRALPQDPDNFQALNSLPPVTVDVTATRRDAGKSCVLEVRLHNPTRAIALMTHLQLRRQSGQRVLPVSYTDNYLSLLPGETRTVRIEAALKDLSGEQPVIAVDGWNLAGINSGPGVNVILNPEAQLDSLPATGLAISGQ